MISLSLIIIMINSFYFQENHLKLLILTLNFFGLFTLYALGDVTEKWLMEAKNISFYYLLFLEGLFGLILVAIIITLLVILPDDYIKVIEFEENFINTMKRIFSSYQTILLFIFDIFLLCSYYVFHCIIIFYFSPIHKTVAETFYTFVFVLIITISPKTNSNIFMLICFSIAFVIFFYFALFIMKL